MLKTSGGDIFADRRANPARRRREYTMRQWDPQLDNPIVAYQQRLVCMERLDESNGKMFIRMYERKWVHLCRSTLFQIHMFV